MSSELKAVFTPIKGSRTFEEVSNQIKKLIFDGVFKPGDKLLPETESPVSLPSRKAAAAARSLKTLFPIRSAICF
jgi:hypothetical protein